MNPATKFLKFEEGKSTLGSSRKTRSIRLSHASIFSSFLICTFSLGHMTLPCTVETNIFFPSSRTSDISPSVHDKARSSNHTLVLIWKDDTIFYPLPGKFSLFLKTQIYIFEMKKNPWPARCRRDHFPFFCFGGFFLSLSFQKINNIVMPLLVFLCCKAVQISFCTTFVNNRKSFIGN